MNFIFFTNTYVSKILFASIVGIFILTSCSDDIDESNRYTFTGETITDYLENRSDIYSDYIKILNRAKIGKSSSGSILNTLSTWGTYTCFAPTNDAVKKFLIEQDSIYWKNVEMLENGEIDAKDFHDTGIHSPYIEDLSDSMASEIAKNHIIERAFLTTDLSEGAFPSSNMNSRFMTLSWVNDEGGNVRVKINNNSLVVESDIKVENGVIQSIDAVLNPSTSQLPDLLKSQESFSIFTEALFLTGLDDSLRSYRDDNYTLSGLGTPSFAAGRTAPYPKTKFYKFSLLVESNEVFMSNGITNIDELIEFVNKWYGDAYYGSDIDLVDFKSRNNPLNRFIAYHILDRQLQYASGSGPGGFIMENFEGENSSFKSEFNMPTTFDRYDYFETMLPYTSIKVTRPFTNPSLSSEIVLNYGQESGTRLSNATMRNHINVIVQPISIATTLPGLENFDQNAINGIIHTIDKILVYNENEMAGNILFERMRWDTSSLFPELTNNDIRWAQMTNSVQEYSMPNNFFPRLRINSEDSKVYYMLPCGTGAGGWVNFMGDEFIVTGIYDFEYRLPHVPVGTYELRFGFALGYYRGVCQFYVDGKVTGIPVDLRLTAQNEQVIGWIADTGDKDEDDENDKSMRNRGYMKGFDSCIVGGDGTSIRGSKLACRKIITMAYLGKGDHWLRFKDVTANNDGQSQFTQDYLEIVPKGIITDISKPEDKH